MEISDTDGSDCYSAASDEEDMFLDGGPGFGSSFVAPACRYTVIDAAQLEKEQARRLSHTVLSVIVTHLVIFL